MGEREAVPEEQGPWKWFYGTAAFHTRRRTSFYCARIYSPFPSSGYRRVQRVTTLENPATLGQEGVTRYACSTACLLTLDGRGVLPTSPCACTLHHGPLGGFGREASPVAAPQRPVFACVCMPSPRLPGCHGRPRHPTGNGEGGSTLGMVQ